MSETLIETNIPLNPLEVDIYKSITDVFKEWFERKEQSITKVICNAMSVIGQNQGYEVYTSAYRDGWIFDLAWLKKNDLGQLEELGLCLESELSVRTDAGLLTDFNKLLIADSKTKVFICFEKPWKHDFPNSVNSIVTLLSNAISSYSGSIKQRVLVLIFTDYWDGDLYPFVLTN